MVSPDPFALRLIGLETANIWSRDNYSNWLINDIIDSIKNEGFKIKYLPKGIKIKEI